MTWTHGQVEWDGDARLDLKDSNNSHLVTFRDKNSLWLHRESNGEKWTLTKQEDPEMAKLPAPTEIQAQQVMPEQE